MSTTEAAPPGVLDPAAIAPNIDHIVTEDDTPVDNMFSEKAQRLLTEPLYSSWPGPGEGRPYIAAANVGVFAAVAQPALVPDMFLSLDVQAPQDLWPKHHRSYFLWEYGKPPEVAIEIVSNRKGQEAGGKMRDYARIGVIYYVIYDPDGQLRGQPLRIYELHAGKYTSMAGHFLQEVGLGLTLWQGVYEGVEAVWLRWCESDGTLIPSGAERADHERERADHERERADHERERAERLAEQLRALGVNPEDV